MQRRIGLPVGARVHLASSMGSILQFFDLNQTNLSRKLLGHKRHVEGLEAPRNSMEFYIEAPQNSNILHDDIPYSCKVRRQSNKANIFPNGTIMKKLIDEEMSKRTNDRRNTPSVVARLMGMDSLPSDVKPTTFPREGSKYPKPSSSLPRNKNSTQLAPTSTPVTKTGQDSLAYGVKNDSRPREHPQEEVLQKFKKEFEEWQASRVWEHSSSYELGNHHRQKNFTRFPAQEKLARCGDPKRNAAYKKSAEPKHYVSIAEHEVFLQYEGHTKFEEKHNRSSSSSRLRHQGRISNQLAVTNSGKKHDGPSSSPTRIVILKAGSEQYDGDAEESWSRSPEVLEKEGSMKEFLEEVKERLKSEMLGNARNGAKARDVIIAEASFGERSPDTKQFARHIAKKIKENVTRDIRSASISTTYRNEVQLERPESPKFVNRDARRLFSDRLKNVLRIETPVDVHRVINERTRLAEGRIRSHSIDDFSNLGNKMRYTRTQNESNASTFVGGLDQKGAILEAAPVSPRNLVRSFSAPVSGRAFGRLLLEDQHVLTGAHIRRKHEASELKKKKKRKDGFNLKGTVSSFRHNFILKSKFFGKKTPLVDECKEKNDFSSLRPIVTVPSVVEKFGAMLDNSTEVPPSPASLTDSSQDDFFRPDHPSPVSPLERAFIADQTAPKLSTDHISSMFSEPEELSEQAYHGGCEELAADKIHPFEDETFGVVEDHIEGYIRHILIAAGLYDAQAISSESLPRWSGSTKPIPNWVFDKIEETYSEGKLDYGETILSRRMLFDSVNEALPCVLKVPPAATSRCKFKNLGPEYPVPHGKILLHGLWSHIERNLNLSSNESSSLDDMVAEDVRTAPWFSVLRADEDAIGRKLEWMILADVIDELVQDVSTWPVQG